MSVPYTGVDHSAPLASAEAGAALRGRRAGVLAAGFVSAAAGGTTFAVRLATGFAGVTLVVGAAAAGVAAFFARGLPAEARAPSLYLRIALRAPLRPNFGCAEFRP
ncbi:hypothetical protein [Sphingomonas oryzagri]|uniref:MFS transporter n=1 Tax=Sphingomonas oryzagri TaxID=3042314 RepID=A0ABT6N374_9SPHN|nr:hypothetical protein [Sphingomonas oryzagri]MDH7639213.1 hypothetical protein [Sphingomonas oryzagri]